ERWLLDDYSPHTSITVVLNRPRIDVCWISTVSIFLMPAFFFAVAMLASPVAIRPSRLVAVPVPFLAQLVALFSASTGRLWPEYRRPGWNGAVAQPVMASAEAIKAA